MDFSLRPLHTGAIIEVIIVRTDLMKSVNWISVELIINYFRMK